jgi:nitrate reductase NapA
MDQTRREFLKAAVAASVASSLGLPVSPAARAEAQRLETQWKWDKAVCRFCGVGCGIQIATKEGRVRPRSTAGSSV